MSTQYDLTPLFRHQHQALCGGNKSRKARKKMTTQERNKLIGSRIYDARKDAAMTQKQVGEALGYKPGLAQAYVSDWEDGTRPVPRRQIAALAALLKLDLKDLL